MRATFAVLRREWHVQLRYPVSMFSTVIMNPLYQLVLPTLLLGSAFVVAGQSLGLLREAGTVDLAGWLAAGVFLAMVTVGAMTSVYETLDADRTTGALEHTWTTPASHHVYVGGAVLTGTTMGGAAAVVLGAFGVALGARFDGFGLLASVPVMALAVLGNLGFGYLVASSLLLMRRADVLAEVGTMTVVGFSGVTFPLTLLPDVVRWPTYLLPGTWALDLTRVLSLHTRPLAPVLVEVLALVATSSAWLAVGAVAFARADRSVARAGTLAQY